jgi:hypothetical protein
MLQRLHPNKANEGKSSSSLLVMHNQCGAVGVAASADRSGSNGSDANPQTDPSQNLSLHASKASSAAFGVD